MANETQLQQILKRLDAIDNKLKSLSKIEKNISTMQKDIALIKECVPFENAATFPRIKKTKKTTGGKGAGYAMAAASK